MKFWNMYETDSVNVTAGQLLFDDSRYVSMSATAGGLTFIHTMSTEQARRMGKHLVELADKVDAEATLALPGVPA